MRARPAAHIASAREVRISWVNKSETKVSAAASIWLSNQTRDILIRSLQMTYFHDPCKAWRSATPLRQTRSRFGNKEMCHAEIHRCSRVGLADCDTDAHPDCKRSPRVTGELLVRRQRLLTNSRANEHFCSRLNSQDGWLALARRPPATTRLPPAQNEEGQPPRRLV